MPSVIGSVVGEVIAEIVGGLLERKPRGSVRTLERTSGNTVVMRPPRDCVEVGVGVIVFALVALVAVMAGLLTGPEKVPFFAFILAPGAVGACIAVMVALMIAECRTAVVLSEHGLIQRSFGGRVCRLPWNRVRVVYRSKAANTLVLSDGRSRSVAVGLSLGGLPEFESMAGKRLPKALARTVVKRLA